MRANIKDRTDRELYILVFNTESLWKLRHSMKLMSEIIKLYEYTLKQLEVLIEALDSEREE